jgi:lipopolysaccharide exporter
MTAGPSPGYARQLAISAAFMVGLRFAFRAIGLVSTLILVRLLSPADFGTVGLAMVTFAILDAMSDLSFEKVLIRQPDPQPDHYNTAWTLNIIRGAAVAVALVAAGPLLALFVDEPNVEPICYAVAVMSLLQGCQNIGMVNYQRAFQFSQIFKFQLAAKIVGFVVTITAAFLLRNFWALVIGTIASRLILVPLSYAMHPYRPRLSLTLWKDMFHFSKWMVVSNIQIMIENYTMVLVVGRIGGPTGIGLFQVANEIGTLPASEVAAPIRQPLYVSYTRHLDDMRGFRHQYISGLGLTLTLLIPACIGLWLMASPITTLFLGAKWTDAQPILELCALLGLFEAAAHCTNDVFTALNRQDRFAKLYMVCLAVRVSAIIAGALLGHIEGAVVGLLASTAFNAVFLNVHVARLIGLTIIDYVRSIWRSLAATAVMSACVLWFSGIWTEPSEIFSAFVRLFAISGLGAAVHISTLFALWRATGSQPGPEAHLLKVVQKSFEKFFGRTASAAPGQS